MANKVSTIVVSHRTESLQSVKDMLLAPSSKSRQALLRIQKFFGGAAGGNRDCSFTVECNTGEEAASTGTITLSSFVATDTFTVGTEVFTSSAAPSGNNQFLSTGGDTVVAAAAVVKINAHPNLSRVVTATSALGVITLTAAVKGLIGNQIPLAISAHGSVSAAKMASGVNATTYSTKNTYHAGL